VTDEQIIEMAKQVFGGPESACLSGRGERDREVTVEEYPIGEYAIAFARLIEGQVREECAAVCVRFSQIVEPDYEMVVKNCAAAIRGMK
jgi:hypothetical protein